MRRLERRLRVEGKAGSHLPTLSQVVAEGNSEPAADLNRNPEGPDDVVDWISRRIQAGIVLRGRHLPVQAESMTKLPTEILLLQIDEEGAESTRAIEVNNLEDDSDH
ncbi:hypothetical protein EV356DRAFT_498116 [Viridothelium virens]|uniref:Uncharacterized protein n=1 Tax=Viridothelium virens TaxID=1048519 RepID=A0A6A6HFH9_VIRVR|nr:hypothetical protein EV356DRAFT_498116 [Viridothelium virens]